MESIWRKTCEIKPRKALNKDIKTNTAIIGAGMAGILIATRLKEKGIDCIIIEADRIASGTSQYTTAKITAQHGHVYDKLIKTLDFNMAKQYAMANLEAIKDYENLIKDRIIDCSFEIKDSYVYSMEDEKAILNEVDSARKLGLPASFESNLELPFNVVGAVKFEKQAQFHPLKFIKELAKDLEIYEQTRATVVKDNEIETSTGNTVTAENIVFACHYPFVNFPGQYFMRMHQEHIYFLALQNVPQIHGMYIGLGNEGYSLRNYKHYLIIGDGNHRTGENTSGGKYEKIRQAAKELYPESKEVASWSSQDCISTDGVPYIGLYSKDKPNWYVATGFMKWGMTTSMVSANIISDMICGKKPNNADVFVPQRFSLKDVPQMTRNSGKSIKALSKEYLTVNKKKIDDILLGHAEVVSIDGEEYGVYKDMDGKVFIVSAKCPHLHCRLEWNADEKSWDCPCHGSRFDYRGNVLDSPAQEDIKVEID